MAESKKGKYMATLQRLNEIIAQKDKDLLLKEYQQHLKTLDNLLKVVTILNTIEKKRENLKNELATLKGKKQSVARISKHIAENVEELKEKFETGVFNSYMSKINIHRVIEHHSIVLPFISVPQDYRVSDQFLPWSFGTNKAELFEIEASNLNYKYKQNRNYKKLSVPNIVYLNHSEKNITKFEKLDNFTAKLKVNNFIYIQANMTGTEGETTDSNNIRPVVFFTLDGTDPSRFNHVEGSPDLIYISKSCTLKLRAFKPGYIESNMLILDVDVESRKEDTVKFALESMVRPEFEASDNNTMDIGEEGLSDIDEDIFVNENFASWHDYGTFSTPKD